MQTGNFDSICSKAKDFAVSHLPGRLRERYFSIFAGCVLAGERDDMPEDSLTVRTSKNDRQRQTRRRDHDDNLYGNTPEPVSFPAFSVSSSAPEMDATVNWFNAEKGYGFVALADGSGDVFLHVNTLQASGLQTVSPGAKLKIRVGNGQKGRQVDQVLSVSEGTGEAPPPRQPAGGRPPRAEGPRRSYDPGATVEMAGTVKWYNAEKGFGFISPTGGGKDIFVHATALERGGLATLNEGQSVRMAVAQGAKGPEAASVTLE